MSADFPTPEEAARWNRMDWNLEAAEEHHRLDNREARADWIEDNYEPDGE